MQCNAKIQYSKGQRCPREAIPGKSKCKSHGNGGPRTIDGRKAIARARSKGMNDSLAERIAHRKASFELYMLAKLAGVAWTGRPPKKI
ncbi:hypothetical protein C7H79_09740 [Nitrosomonas supralitoralis]|uniref:Uncharacterized protein n=1 Tax=Nitrosomonas supralitoralis TaxID=2116706 RepID=A0A2P7NUM1_9PROT|nr:hypothetical protein C7H79_09740 [Nitrosomonas supralitoralis]